MGREPVLKSGSFLDDRVAWSGAGSTAGRAARRPAAGFWRVGGRVEGSQELRKRLADARGREGAAVGPLGALPGETAIVDDAAGQPELGIRQQHQPGPAIRRLGVADARGGPVEGLLAEAVGVLNGTVTSDKFCVSRYGRLRLTWWRRPLRRRQGVAGTPSCSDSGTGGSDATHLANPSEHGRATGWASSLGSGVPTPPALGGRGATGGRLQCE